MRRDKKFLLSIVFFLDLFHLPFFVPLYSFRIAKIESLSESIIQRKAVHPKKVVYSADRVTVTFIFECTSV